MENTRAPDRKVGACWECGYPLRGLESRRCPECGRPFDPDDPATMNMDYDVPALARWLMRPPGWPLYLLMIIAMVLSLWAAAAPMRPNEFFLVLVRLRHDLARASWWDVIQTPRLIEVRYFYAAAAWVVVASLWAVRRIVRGIVVMRVSRQRAAVADPAGGLGADGSDLQDAGAGEPGV